MVDVAAHEPHVVTRVAQKGANLPNAACSMAFRRVDLAAATDKRSLSAPTQRDQNVTEPMNFRHRVVVHERDPHGTGFHGQVQALH
jgi:hypothetical protein